MEVVYFKINLSIKYFFSDFTVFVLIHIHAKATNDIIGEGCGQFKAISLQLELQFV